MTNHAKIYLSYFSIGIDEVWQCEMCGKQDRIVNLQIHHIYGRGKGKDVIGNLMCLCRECHSKAHASKEYVSKADFFNIHLSFLEDKNKRINQEYSGEWKQFS